MRLGEQSTEYSLLFFLLSGDPTKSGCVYTRWLSPQRLGEVKLCDGFSTYFQLLLTFYWSLSAGVEMPKVFTERVQDGQT